MFQGFGQAESGKLLEYFIDVVADFLIAGQQAEIRIEAGSSWMVVTGSEVDITPQDTAATLVFSADDHQHLGVRLVTNHAVNHMRANLLQLGRPADIGLLVKAGHQFDDDRHLLAVLCRTQQGLHQDGIGAGAVNGHFDRDYLRVRCSLIQQFDDRDETLVRMVQQDVSGADRIECRTGFLDCFGGSGLERSEFQVIALNQIRNLH